MAEFVVRPARAGDAWAMAELMAAVAQERDGIATEPPVELWDSIVMGLALSPALSGPGDTVS